jgi:hypothetical protein
MIRKMLQILRAVIGGHRTGPASDYFFVNRGQTVWGSISDEDEKIIAELTKKAARIDGPIIEIGALFGFTTQLIATNKPADKKLIAVENFSWNPFGIPPDDHRVITNRVLRYVMAHCNTTVFDGSSQEFYKTYQQGTPSMIFIDAGHTYEDVKKDISWAIEQGIPIISGHDYHPLHPGVVRAVDEMLPDNKKIVSSVWYSERS